MPNNFARVEEAGVIYTVQAGSRTTRIQVIDRGKMSAQIVIPKAIWDRLAVRMVGTPRDLSMVRDQLRSIRIQLNTIAANIEDAEDEDDDDDE